MDSRRLELQQDIAEIDHLLAQSARQGIQARLLLIKTELQNELNALAPPAPKIEEETKAEVPEHRDPLTYKPIERFGWDQTFKEVKIYVTCLDGLKEAKDRVTVHHTSDSVDIKIADFRGINYRLRFGKLNMPISDCQLTLKSSGFSLTLKKKSEATWDSLEHKPALPGQQAKPELEEDSKDPGAGLMKMMKDLYENGDEDMKRTIAEAWTKAQDKKGEP